MRTGFYAIAMAALLIAGARAADLPNPPGCAGYTENKIGGDATCDDAIAKETDPAVKSVLLYRRAYMIIDRTDFKTYPKALADLDEAIRLLPGNDHALRERAYVYNEYGRWAEAKRDLDSAIALAPQEAGGYTERAMSRFYLGDLEGQYDDRNTAVLLNPKNVRALINRADAALWLGRFTDAKLDLDNAESLGKSTEDEAQDIKDWRDIIKLMQATSGANAAKTCLAAFGKKEIGGRFLIGDCTRAFLDATTNKARADALTVRAVGWQLDKRDEMARADYALAVALDPDNPETHSNLGYSYLDARHSTAGIAEFDRSIALKPSYVAYAGRASGKLNLNDLDGAFADAKKSFEMQPNMLALWIVGDVVYARTNSYDEAKKFWIGAYRLGGRDDRLIERLKKAGVPIPPPETDDKPAIP